MYSFQNTSVDTTLLPHSTTHCTGSHSAIAATENSSMTPFPELVFPIKRPPIKFPPLPKNKRRRREAKKKRRCILRKFKKLKPWIDYFTRENNYFIEKARSFVKDIESKHDLIMELHRIHEEEAAEQHWCYSKGRSFTSCLDDTDEYTISDFFDDHRDLTFEIMELYRYHAILSDVAKEKGIVIEPLSEEFLNDVEYFETNVRWLD